MIELHMLAALSQLTDNEREVVVDSVVLGRSLRDIAKDMGIGHQRASQLKKQGLHKLAVYMEPYKELV